jgi:hypothetical protein
MPIGWEKSRSPHWNKDILDGEIVSDANACRIRLLGARLAQSVHSLNGAQDVDVGDPLVL